VWVIGNNSGKSHRANFSENLVSLETGNEQHNHYDLPLRRPSRHPLNVGGDSLAHFGRTDNNRQKLAMKLIIWVLQAAAIWSSLLPTTCAAHDGGLHFKVTGRPNPPNTRYNKRGNIIGSSTLSNSADISYFANVTLGGASFSVLIGGCGPLPLQLILSSSTLDTGR